MQRLPNKKRYFTLEEARGLLPHVRRMIEAIARRVHHVESLSEAMEMSVRADRVIAEAELEVLQAEVQVEVERLLEEITRQGVLVKGIRPALLDFPALRNGRDVYLCWREGEEDVCWWHPEHLGIAGREPLEGDEPGYWEWSN